MTGGWYKLEGKIPVPCESPLEWAIWLEGHDAERVVKQETVGRLWVSTCFIGLNHNFGPGPPLLFETMIFTEPDEEGHRQATDYQTRCETWELALEHHERAVEWARQHQLREPHQSA